MPESKHINFYGEYAFRDTGDIINLDEIIGRLIAHTEARQPIAAHTN